MKKSKIIMFRKKIYTVMLIVIISFFILSCSSDDDGGSPNQPPNAFNLTLFVVGPLVGDINLTWQTATDPDGDQVVYDVYLAKEGVDLALIANDLTATNYLILEADPTITAGEDYQWQVIAKDGNGGETDSNIGDFSTAN